MLIGKKVTGKECSARDMDAENKAWCDRHNEYVDRCRREDNMYGTIYKFEGRVQREYDRIVDVLEHKGSVRLEVWMPTSEIIAELFPIELTADKWFKGKDMGVPYVKLNENGRLMIAVDIVNKQYKIFSFDYIQNIRFYNENGGRFYNGMR